MRAISQRPSFWAALDPERRSAVLIIGGVGLIVVVALALVAYGYYLARIAPRHETLIRVGGREFDYAFVERRAKAELAQGSFGAGSTSQGVALTLALVEREEVLRRAAAAAGLTASEAEVEAQIRERLGLAEDVSRDMFAARYRAELLRLGLSPAEYREIALAEVLEAKLRAQLGASVPAQTEFVSLRLIQLKSREEAASVRERVLKDETGLGVATSFAYVATQVSVHSSKAEGGDMGWLPRGSLPDALEAAAFSQTGLSDVIEVEGGFFLLYVRGTELREVSDVDRAKVVDQTLAETLQRTREELHAEVLATAEQLQRLAASLVRARG